MTIQEAMGKAVLLPYQKQWLLDKALVKVWEKSRRIGASYAEALNCVLIAMLTKPAGGMNCYYLSYSKEMTQQFITDCAFWAHILGIACSDMEEAVIKDEDKDIMVYRIRFASGFEIWGLPSVPRSLRSKQGHAVIDEAAFVDDLAELLKAAMALLMWGGSVSILSTHNGDDNPFNILIQQIHSGDKDYSLHHTTITDALADGLYKRICETKDKEWSEEIEKHWLAQLEKDYGEAAEEELYCIPARSGERYFPAALIAQVAVKDKPVFRFAVDDSFTFEKSERREKQCRQWFKQVKPVLLASDFPVCFGEDFARSGDLTVLHFDMELSDGNTDTLCVVELRNIPFAQQWQFIKLCCDTLKNFDGAAFDSRGNGQMIAELAAQEYPGCIFQVMLSRQWYAENMPRLKTAFEDNTTNIPDDSFIKDDYKVVSLVQGIPLITDRTGNKRSKRHGDHCIAKAMSLFAHNELEESGYQPMTYEAVSSPNRFRTKGDDDEW
ncbi:MAG: hypothetical protein NC041_07195 [Bacteroides sp.]|nr:hypothetical protein [Prevotella sp.]MCM1407083.1 hypothetical protein [Treponema brennaborense]MCM1470235.1 hypothetical protein [Bacteroides sp.]